MKQCRNRGGVLDVIILDMEYSREGGLSNGKLNYR